MLLSAGAKFDTCNDSPLWYAVSNRKINMVELLLNAGSPTEQCMFNHEGYTPLIEAVTRNFSDIAKHLVMHGANPNVTCKYHFSNETYTPLCIAIDHGNLGLVQFLIHQGANIHYVTPEKKNMLVWMLYQMSRGQPYETLLDYVLSLNLDINPIFDSCCEHLIGDQTKAAHYIESKVDTLTP